MGLLDLFGHKYPFTDFHELNLDWCITAVLQLQKAFEDFSAGNKLIFANPLKHDLTKTYAKNTIVVDSVSGTAYLSLDSVPKGVQLDNADYWLPVFDFAGYVTRANQNFTDNYFSGTDRTPHALAVGDWVVLDDVLYKVLAAMAADDLFIIGTNIVHFTVEQFLKDFITSVNQTLYEYSLTIQQYKDDIDASEQQYKEEIDASELAYRQQLAQDIATTTASLQAQLNAAISGATVDSEVINARVGADGITYPTLGDAIRTQFENLNGTLMDQVTPWEAGSINYANGELVTSTSSSRMQELHNLALIYMPTSYPIAVFVYKNGVYQGVYDRTNDIVEIPAVDISPYIHDGLWDLTGFGEEYTFRAVKYGTPEYDYLNSHTLVMLRKWGTVTSLESLLDVSKAIENSAVDGAINLKPDLITGGAGSGASRNENILTIPTGSTGYNSYVQGRYMDNLAYLPTGADVIFVFKITDSSDFVKENELKILDVNGTLLSSNPAKMIHQIGNIKTFVLPFVVPAVFTHSIRPTYQTKNNIAVAADVTVEIDFYAVTPAYTDHVVSMAEFNYDEHVITVGTSGKDYTSLRAALEYCASHADKNNHYIVEFYGEGVTYDAYDDIDPAVDLLPDATYIGLSVPAYTTLRGMGSYLQNIVTLTFDNSVDPDAAERISCINLLENGQVENMWFIASGCRYACHDDMHSYNPNWQLKTVKNCRFTSDHTLEHRAYGAGIRSGVNWQFDNCIFENVNGEETQYGGASFSVHNNNAIEKSPSITFNNCIFDAGSAFNNQSLNRTAGQTFPNAQLIIVFNGCKFTSHLWDREIILTYSAYGTLIESILSGTCNNIDNTGVGVYDAQSQSFVPGYESQYNFINKI